MMSSDSTTDSISLAGKVHAENRYNSPADVNFSSSRIGRHYVRLGRGQMDALFDNKASDILIVSLHGALDRTKYSIPRFERFRTLRELPYSTLYLSDPALSLGTGLRLSWYVGYDEVDTVQEYVEWIQKAAEASNARQILLTGSSGGGFGALQMMRQISGAMALVFQPQTVISNYYPGFVSDFVETCFPMYGRSWEAQLGERVSVLESPISSSNRIRYVQNVNDTFHYQFHFGPYLRAQSVELPRGNSSVDAGPLSVTLYDGPKGHTVPTSELFLRELRAAVKQLSEWNPNS